MSRAGGDRFCLICNCKMGDGSCSLCKKERKKINSILGAQLACQIEERKRESLGAIVYYLLRAIGSIPIFAGIILALILVSNGTFDELWFITLPFFLFHGYLISRRDIKRKKMIDSIYQKPKK